MPQAGFEASQRTKQSSQYAVLKDHLLDNASTSENVLDKFSEPVERVISTSEDSGEVEEQLGTTWKSIISTAALTPFKDPGMPKLVDLILALQERTDVQKNNRVFQVEDMTIWQDLPMFGWQMREAWNLGASRSGAL